MRYAVNILSHVREVQRCARQLGAEASINVNTFVLEVKARNRYYAFTPQFIVIDDEGSGYTPELRDETLGFIGWRPYDIKHWKIATRKLEFKSYCRQTGLNTPEWWTASSDNRNSDQEVPVIIKHDRQSFGEGMRGPFPTWRPSESAAKLENGEFAERFIEGRICKSWFWNGRLMCIEMEVQPAVTGDGTQTLRQLAEQLQGKSKKKPDWELVGACAAYQGIGLDEVPAAGRKLLVDYRYGSPFRPLSGKNENVLHEFSRSAAFEGLTAAGAKLYQGIPEAKRRNTVFTVDFILDENDRIWLLEMNSNPIVHPSCYEPMLQALFDTSPAAGDQWQQAPLEILSHAVQPQMPVIPVPDEVL